VLENHEGRCKVLVIYGNVLIGSQAAVDEADLERLRDESVDRVLVEIPEG
jgi:hypothetical protein